MQPLILLVLISIMGSVSTKDVQNIMTASDSVDQIAELKKIIEAQRIKINELEKRDTFRIKRHSDLQAVEDAKLLESCKSLQNAYYTASQDKLKIKYCSKMAEGSADEILRKVFADVLEAFLGGALRCSILGGVHTGTQCLYFSNETETTKSWKDAITTCKEMNNGKGELASIKDHSEVNRYIDAELEGQAFFWVGASYDKNTGKWTWLSEDAFDDKLANNLDTSDGSHCLRAMSYSTSAYEGYQAASCALADSRYICDLGNKGKCNEKYKSLRTCLLNKKKGLLKILKKVQKKREKMGRPRKRSKRGIFFGIWSWLFGFGLGDDDTDSRDLCDEM